MSDDLIGPALPPSFRRSSDEDSDEEDTLVGPALPPGYKPVDLSSSSDNSDQEEVVFKRGRPSGREERSDGPTANKLPRVEETDERRAEEEEEEDDGGDDDDGFFGPALPPGYQKQQNSPERPPVLGPALPPGFLSPADDEDESNDETDSLGFPGPALPPGYTAEASSGEEDDVIGPMPVQGDVQNTVAQDFERRAQRMKEKLTSGDAGPEDLARETWMTELPPELQHIGLEARAFKRKSGPASKDRSIWTDTPADRERKARERLEGKPSDESPKEEMPCIPKKDLQMADKVSKYNESKRGESLISMHGKVMKRKAAEKKDDGPAERRPFDRDADLQVNRFDEAQKKSLIKKSQELNTRFSHSKDRMFL